MVNEPPAKKIRNFKYERLNLDIPHINRCLCKRCNHPVRNDGSRITGAKYVDETAYHANLLELRSSETDDEHVPQAIDIFGNELLLLGLQDEGRVRLNEHLRNDGSESLRLDLANRDR